ncbi:hypothetical protein B0H15DRAFT_943476 [Mycena belliarum]|uniref:Alpha-amylase n=1 Tax=Mycena belliarum TaxID=1033014 RepID=A0AAD6XVP4_9AGAR|nr:hypothetical protein B0H15DRAFT_943476 [Mycena belliae]
MPRITGTILFAAATFTSLCLAAPLSERSLSSSATSSSTSAPHASPSATQQNATSTPTHSVVPNWTAFANGTTGFALNQLLTRTIGPDALEHWVTSDVASTEIGSSDPGRSNADLSKTVNTAFGGGNWSHKTWVETYLDFLIEGGGNATVTDAENKTFTDYMNSTKMWAAEQVNLVRAYVSAHPGNVTYVGIDIANVSRVDGLDMEVMKAWGEAGGDCTSGAGGNITSSTNSTSNLPLARDNNSTASDNCTYAAEDYAKFLSAASTHFDLQGEIAKFSTQVQMPLRGYQLRQIFPNLGIFNLSMDTGGEGTSTRFDPAWTATIIGISRSVSVQDIAENLDDGPGESTSNNTDRGVIIGGLPKRGTSFRSAKGFGSLQFIANGIHPTTTTTAVNTPPVSKVHTPAAAAAAPAPAPASNSPDSDPLNQPLPDDESFVLLSLQEGSWADRRGDYITYAREHAPDVLDKYFGRNGTGSGPIGRRWSHLVLLMNSSNKNGTSTAVLAKTFGMVYETLPLFYFASV